MKRIIAITALALSLAAGSFAGGTWWVHRSGAAHTSAHAKAVYTCPMHPDTAATILATARSAECASRRFGPGGNGRRRRGRLVAARRGAGESRSAAGDRHPGRRRRPVGRHQGAADDRACGARREPDVSDRRRRERLDPGRGKRHDGRHSEEGPGARIIPRARARVQERAAVCTTRASRRFTAWR